MADHDEQDRSADPDAHLRERLLEPGSAYRGSFLDVRRDLVVLPDGSTAAREYIMHPGAVAVVPLLADRSVVLVRQHRYPLDRMLLELPAGKRDAGETTLACAQRELLEETGYRAAQWGYGGVIHNAAAYSSEHVWIWFARELTAGPAQLDDGEFVETVLIGEAELEAMERRGDLTDVKTVVGLHWLLAWRCGRREIGWIGADAPAPL